MKTVEILKDVLNKVDPNNIRDNLPSEEAEAYKLVLYFMVDPKMPNVVNFDIKLWKVNESGFEFDAQYIKSDSMTLTDDEINELLNQDVSNEVEEMVRTYMVDKLGKVESLGTAFRASIQSGNYIFKFR